MESPDIASRLVNDLGQSAGSLIKASEKGDIDWDDEKNQKNLVKFIDAMSQATGAPVVSWTISTARLATGGESDAPPKKSKAAGNSLKIPKLKSSIQGDLHKAGKR